MDCSPPVHGILQARILEWVAMPFTTVKLDYPRITRMVQHIQINVILHINKVQFSSATQLCLTPCDPIDGNMPGLPVHHQLLSFLKLMFIKSVMPSNHLSFCHPLQLPPSIFPSIRIFSNESALPIRWPNYWSFSISHSNEHSGLISFRMDWLNLLAVRGTIKSLLQQHSSKASIL